MACRRFQGHRDWEFREFGSGPATDPGQQVQGVARFDRQIPRGMGEAFDGVCTPIDEALLRSAQFTEENAA